MYLVALALIVFLPADDAKPMTGVVAMVANWLATVGVPFDVGYTVLEFLANVALFVPLGVLLPLTTPLRRPWQVLAVGVASTGFIELVQLTIPGRVSSWSDVAANTIGTAVGLAFHAALEAARHRPQPSEARAR